MCDDATAVHVLGGTPNADGGCDLTGLDEVLRASRPVLLLLLRKPTEAAAAAGGAAGGGTAGGGAAGGDLPQIEIEGEGEMDDEAMARVGCRVPAAERARPYSSNTTMEELGEAGPCG